MGELPARKDDGFQALEDGGGDEKGDRLPNGQGGGGADDGRVGVVREAGAATDRNAGGVKGMNGDKVGEGESGSRAGLPAVSRPPTKRLRGPEAS